MKIFSETKEYGAFYDDVVKLTGIKDSDVFVDIGANLGQEIEYFSKLNVIIDSYEPHPYFFDKIVKKFEHLPNVKITNAAVWSKKCASNFYFKKSPDLWGDNHRSGGASLYIDKINVQSEYSTQVECIDIVDIVSSHDKIKILKIDAEGAEYDILLRLFESSLITKPEFIFFEDHERKMTSRVFMNNKRQFANLVNQNGLTLYNW